MNFVRDTHVKYFKRCLQLLPHHYTSLDVNRLTVAYFCLSGLDILGAIDTLPGKKEIIDWIYNLQIARDPADPAKNAARCGFRGGTSLGLPFDPSGEACRGCPHPMDGGHIAMTYTALACLGILGDDYSRVDRASVVMGLRQLQLPDGSFCTTAEGSENDMRFVYCACVISSMLGDWSGVNVDAVVDYIKRSFGYDGGFGQGPHLEAHGGSTYCAVASLQLLGKLDTALTADERDRLVRWCLMRQECGFHGRPNKLQDTCYSFWIGASLKILGAFEMIDEQANRGFLLRTQSEKIGGFGKHEDSLPDILHSYFGIAAFSLMEMENLSPLNAALNVTQRTATHIATLHHQ
eukprot:Opistho-2@54328